MPIETAEFVIRLLDANDSIASLTGLLHAAYARLGEMGFNYTAVDQTEKTTRARIAQGDCLVALDRTTLVGTLMVHAPGTSDGSPYLERSNVATINQFGVLPRFQRRGIGKLLLDEAERRAALAGAAELALDTSEGADHLIAWYERHGFRIIDYVQWEEKTYRSVVMSKALRTPRTIGSSGKD
jgi:ribosomal protein S18 acetylase RimI-like enzyme